MPTTAAGQEQPGLWLVAVGGQAVDFITHFSHPIHAGRGDGVFGLAGEHRRHQHLPPPNEGIDQSMNGSGCEEE